MKHFKNIDNCNDTVVAETCICTCVSECESN